MSMNLSELNLCKKQSDWKMRYHEEFPETGTNSVDDITEEGWTRVEVRFPKDPDAYLKRMLILSGKKRHWKI